MHVCFYGWMYVSTYRSTYIAESWSQTGGTVTNKCVPVFCHRRRCYLKNFSELSRLVRRLHRFIAHLCHSLFKTFLTTRRNSAKFDPFPWNTSRWNKVMLVLLFRISISPLQPRYRHIKATALSPRTPRKWWMEKAAKRMAFVAFVTDSFLFISLSSCFVSLGASDPFRLRPNLGFSHRLSQRLTSDRSTVC